MQEPCDGLKRGVRIAIVMLLTSLVWAGCHRTYDGEIDAFRCEAEGVFGPPACPERNTCVAGVCTYVGVPFGHVCASDDECPAGSYCMDPMAFGAAGSPRCSHLCCGSADCGPAQAGNVCWLPPDATGGLCWPASELERAAPGEGRAGTSCDADEACRSGVCANNVCADACCGDSYCAEQQVCRVLLSDVAERETFACGAAGGPMPSGFCDSDDDCVSGKCLPADPLRSICAAPCCSSNECVEVLDGTISRPVACRSDDTTLRSCSQLLPTTATGVIGTECVDGDDCRSGVCLKAGGRNICSDSCCDDDSCGDSTAFACLPMKEGATWVLRCVPK